MGEEKCGIKHIDTVQHKIDDAIWDWIKTLLTDQDALDRGLKELMRQRAGEVRPKRLRNKNIDMLIDDTKKKIRRLVQEMANHYDDVVLDAFRQEISQYSKNRDALIDERDRLVSELSNTEITEDQKDRIVATAAKIVRGLDNPSVDNKRQILDILDVHATLYYDDLGKRVEVSCALPESDDVIMWHPSAGMLPDLARDGKPSGARFL